MLRVKYIFRFFYAFAGHSADFSRGFFRSNAGKTPKHRDMKPIETCTTGIVGLGLMGGAFALA
ncbi:MAG: hypothetical protein LBG87_03615, partial [Spirochaetaceae bacterium]|nr:hypothetical protein [Spirochaetaceae bacterium]